VINARIACEPEELDREVALAVAQPTPPAE